MNIPTNKIHFIFDESDIKDAKLLFDGSTDMLEPPIFETIKIIGRFSES